MKITGIMKRLSLASALRGMSENDKIMYIVEKVLNATSPETAVSLEEVVETGIDLGVTEDYPRGKKDGHPWWPRTSVMMGVGSVEAVMANEEIHLHRKKMKKTNGGVRMFYWVDKTKKHEIVTRKNHSDGLKSAVKSTYQELPTVKLTMTMAEKIAKMEANPGKFRLVNGKLVSESWIKTNPDKFQEIYGVSSL